MRQQRAEQLHRLDVHTAFPGHADAMRSPARRPWQPLPRWRSIARNFGACWRSLARRPRRVRGAPRQYRRRGVQRDRASLGSVARRMSSVLRAMRRTRRVRRLGELEWFEVAYRVYLAALVGGGVILWLSGLVTDEPATAEEIADVTTHGPAVLGAFVAIVHRARPAQRQRRRSRRPGGRRRPPPAAGSGRPAQRARSNRSSSGCGRWRSEARWSAPSPVSWRRGACPGPVRRGPPPAALAGAATGLLFVAVAVLTHVLHGAPLGGDDHRRARARRCRPARSPAGGRDRATASAASPCGGCGSTRSTWSRWPSSSRSPPPPSPLPAACASSHSCGAPTSSRSCASP